MTDENAAGGGANARAIRRRHGIFRGSSHFPSPFGSWTPRSSALVYDFAQLRQAASISGPGRAFGCGPRAFATAFPAVLTHAQAAADQAAKEK